MYNLYEHVPEGKQLCLGEYETLQACQRATEIRWDIMKQLGYAKALFHCEKIGTREASVGWVYGDGGADDVVSR